jgi:molybdate transport system substrate-binding protein
MSTFIKARSVIFIFVFCGVYFSHSHSSQAEKILIFAASSLTLPLQEIADSFQQKTPHNVRISFAASSTLARQISHGAPADIFISANQKWMNFLTKTNLAIALSKRIILSNSLVIISPINKYLETQNLNITSIKTILKDGRVGIGDPDHVPLGIYSRQALTNLNLWHLIVDKLAPLSNAQTVLTFVERGEIKAGIVYKSDAYLNKNIKVLFEIPRTTHDKIDYWAALTRPVARHAAQQFFKILFNQSSKDVFKHHGFLVN